MTTPLQEIISNKIFDVAMETVRWGSVLICCGLVLALIAILVRFHGSK